MRRPGSHVPRKDGVQWIIYLGGLGDDADELSAHLRSRREVETLLASTGVPVTTLRAGIIVGHGGISWELDSQLVEHLPVMVTPAGCARGRSRSRSTTSCATWSVCSSCPRPPGASTSAVPRSCSTSRCCAASPPSRPPVQAGAGALAHPRLSSLWLRSSPTSARRPAVRWSTRWPTRSSATTRFAASCRSNRWTTTALQALAERARSAPTERSDRAPGARHAVDERHPVDERHTVDERRILGAGRIGRRPAPATTCRRRRRVVGAGLLGLSLASLPASRRFYVLTFSAAATWGTSAIGSGPLHRVDESRRERQRRRPIVVPVAVGVGVRASSTAARSWLGAYHCSTLPSSGSCGSPAGFDAARRADHLRQRGRRRALLPGGALLRRRCLPSGRQGHRGLHRGDQQPAILP